MSSELKKFLISDNRLRVSDELQYGVFRGGQNITTQVFKAISVGYSHVFNIQVPSQSTIIDRKVLWRCGVVFKVSGLAKAQRNNVLDLLVSYGNNLAFGPFPLNQMVNTSQITINSTTIAQNTRDVVGFLLRLLKDDDLAKYEGYTPTMLDTYGRYADALSINNSNSNYGNSSYGRTPRGSYQVEWISSSPNAVVAPTPDDDTLYIKATFTEPIFVSPFIYAPDHEGPGIYGVQNMTFNFNIGDANRSLRQIPVAGINYITSASIESFTNSELIFNFLTPKPSQLLSSKNIVPMLDCVRYLSNLGSGIPAYANNTPGTAVFQSQSLRLNQIPRYLAIGVRKRMQSQTINDADVFYPIDQLSIQFNNQAGLLSTATKQSLYEMSKKNHLNATWLEYSGWASQNNASMTSANKIVQTSGSFTMLGFSSDIQLSEEYLSVGSLGTFNLQVQVRCENYGSIVNPDSLEMVLVVWNEGVFISERGSSQVFTGVLSKSDVIDTLGQEAVSESDVNRMVGGSFTKNLRTVVSKILPMLPSVIKHVARTGADVLEKQGYGTSGAGRSGAGRSGGMMGKLESRLM